VLQGVAAAAIGVRQRAALIFIILSEVVTRFRFVSSTQERVWVGSRHVWTLHL
jgi:hypothetical protein